MTRKRKTLMPWLSEDLVGLKPHALKLKLLERMANSADALKRFWEKVQKGKRDDCWNWLVSTNTDGYGQFAFYPEPGRKKVNFQAHQIAYFLEHHHIPEGLCVCHSCDNRKCNNANHLFLGTQQDNIRDRDQKGRHLVFRGSANATAKLSEEQVQQVRMLWPTRQFSLTKLAEKFGVSDSCIKGIVYSANWKHLPLPKEQH